MYLELRPLANATVRDGPPKRQSHGPPTSAVELGIQLAQAYSVDQSSANSVLPSDVPSIFHQITVLYLALQGNGDKCVSLPFY